MPENTSFTGNIMNMNRLMSRRDKDGSSHRREKSRDKSADRKSGIISGEGGLISLFKSDSPQKKLDKENAKELKDKIEAIRKRMKQEGYRDVKEEHINFALGSQNASGSVEKAVELLIIFQESLEGIIKPYDPDVYLRGAVNRHGVTCYIDSLLFAMFSRLDSFEPILHTNFDQEPKRRLAALLRVYVNMLRRGLLVHTDITEQLQQAMAECGWEAACSLEQQDVSEAFAQLASVLELPLLSLKMDLYHTGKDDDPDDHKIIQERLLEVAVPDEPQPGKPTVRLEDCLESYFNNRVTVMRRLERSNTNSSLKPTSSHHEEKGEQSTPPHIQVNVSELSWSTPDTPITPGTPSTPAFGRDHAPSIIKRKLILENGEEAPEVPAQADTDSADAESDAVGNMETNMGTVSVRKGSIRKEVNMPAWQFYNLLRPSPIYLHLLPLLTYKSPDPFVLIGNIAWSTSSKTSDNAAVAAHFNTKPVIGICLKRYDVQDGKPVRKNTLIDIPLDIRLPHFIDEDEAGEGSSVLVGQFKLSLVSVICHRGVSTTAGHYISYIRGTSPIVDGDYRSKKKLSNANRPPHYSEERWIRSDDLACPRVDNVNIEDALKDEMPYMLFYQIQPYEDPSPPPGLDTEPPSYTDSTVEVNITESTPLDNQVSYFDGAGDDAPPSIRVSNELERPGTPRRSINLPDDRSEFRRGSVAFTENSMTSTSSSVLATSAPVTPVEETTAQRMSRAASKFARLPNKSRPTSQSGENRVENRISATFSRLNLMKSKEQLSKPETPRESISTSDIPSSEPRKSITIDVPQIEQKAHLTETNHNIGRSKSKKEKKRDKSKVPSEKIDGHHHHTHKDKGKAKSNGMPDRECRIM